MKGGLCEPLVAARSTAGGEGSPGELIAAEAAVFVLDTSIDLAGNPCRERLTMDERKLVVSNVASNQRPERRREWRWEQIEAFRVNRPSARISFRCRSTVSGSTPCAGRKRLPAN